MVRNLKKLFKETQDIINQLESKRDEFIDYSSNFEENSSIGKLLISVVEYLDESLSTDLYEASVKLKEDI